MAEIKVNWNEESQSVSLSYEPTEFKTWNFVVAALEMAVEEAKFHLNLARMQNMQAKAMQAQQRARVAQKINGNILRGT